MKKYLASRLVLILTCVILCLSLLFYVFAKNNKMVNESLSPINSGIQKIDEIIGLPFNSFSNLKNNVKDLFITYEENKKIKKVIVSLENQSDEIKDLQEENKKLRGQLSLKEGLKEKFTLAASVGSRSPESWLSRLKIGVGKKDGLKKNMLVMSEGGVIGQITEIGNTTAAVSLLSDNKSVQNLPVKIMSDGKEIYGIITGFDKEKNAFIVTQMNSNEEIKKNSRVVTSGLDGRTASNLPIGEVLIVENADDSLSKKIFVKSLVNFKAISYVTVVGE